MFEKTYPGYSNQPADMIFAVKMDYVDGSGVLISYSVSDYYEYFIDACRLFSRSPTWHVNTVVIFVSNL